MSTLATLRTATRRLIDEETAADSHVTDAEIDAYLNQATLFLGTQMEWPIQTSRATSVLDQALYSLPSDFISLLDCYFDEDPIKVYERADLPDISSGWQSAESGKPIVIYKADNAVIGLIPPPSLEYADKIIEIQYISTPATLTDDADVPDIHASFQICLPFYAAFLCEKKMGNTKTATENLALFTQHKDALKSKVQRFSGDLMRFRWPG